MIQGIGDLRNGAGIPEIDSDPIEQQSVSSGERAALRRTAVNNRISTTLTPCSLVAAICFIGGVIHPSYGIEEKSKRSLIQADGFNYEYKSEAIKHPTTNEVMYQVGKIVVTDNDEKIVYEESSSLHPSACDGGSAVTKMSLKLPAARMLGGKPEKERSLVVLCGSISGRHQTLKVFLLGATGLRTTVLDFENTKPNLKDTDGDGVYEAQVYRRLLFDDIGYQTTPYMFIYELYVDSSTFGFVPTYGQKKTRWYIDYYQSLLKAINKENLSVHAGPAVAALVATEDKNVICRELKNLDAKGLSFTEVIKWRGRLVSAGYPNFDFNTCNGR
jgi:hypothetical protein